MDGIKTFTPGAWQALQVVTGPKYIRWDIGLVFTVAAGFTGPVYIDTVGWPGNIPPGADAGSFPEGGIIVPDGGRVTPPTGTGGASGTGSGTTGAGGDVDPTGGTTTGGLEETDETTTTPGGCACRGAPRVNNTAPAAGVLLTALALLRSLQRSRARAPARRSSGRASNREKRYSP